MSDRPDEFDPAVTRLLTCSTCGSSTWIEIDAAPGAARTAWRATCTHCSRSWTFTDD